MRRAPTQVHHFTLPPAQDPFIEVHQLLKLVGIADSGGAGKMLVASGNVNVDGAQELRKTAKIRAGQHVQLPGHSIHVHAPTH
jgi:ribosome-associated protein